MKTPLDNFIESILTMYPDSPQDNLTRNQVNSVFNNHPDNRKGFIQFVNTPAYKLSRGIYSVAPMQTNTDISPVYAKKTQSAAVVTIPEQQTSLVPQKDPDFVPFGDFTLIYNLTKSETFFPIYITGESGNGKTKMVYEACAKAKRELIRANITEVTDEDDLIGGFRLIDGNTVWQDGPAIEAMKRGAVLLLDEINLGSPKIMCLQPILEGMPIYIKKINELVSPKEGFTVIATANTKGKSSVDGRYIGSNILNEAFLDRFAITIEHEYPSQKIESVILNQILIKCNANVTENQEFISNLVQWAGTIRKTFSEGAIDEIITTRRLIHILGFYLFGSNNRIKAIEYCIARFDDETKASFKSLYQKFDSTITLSNTEPVSKSDTDLTQVGQGL